jgi:hypothetical protein
MVLVWAAGYFKPHKEELAKLRGSILPLFQDKLGLLRRRDAYHHPQEAEFGFFLASFLSVFGHNRPSPSWNKPTHPKALVWGWPGF